MSANSPRNSCSTGSAPRSRALPDPLGVERAERRRGRDLEHVTPRVIGYRRWIARDALVESVPQLEHFAEGAGYPVTRGDVGVGRCGLLEQVDLGLRKRVVGQPTDDTEPAQADRRECVTAVGCLGDLHDARDRADTEPHVAAADFAPRSMRTTPNSRSPSRHRRVITRYRGSNTRSGKTAYGNNTVPSGNIGIGRGAISVPPCVKHARLRPQRRGERFRSRAATSSYAALDRLGCRAACESTEQLDLLLDRQTRNARGCIAHTVAKARGTPANGPASRLASIRARIARGGVGSRS